MAIVPFVLARAVMAIGNALAVGCARARKGECVKRELTPRMLVAVAALTSSLAVVAVSQPGAAALQSRARQSSSRTATVAVVTTQEFRVAVVATQMAGASTPTAEVRVGIARRVGRSWREFVERRLDETFFWNTLSRPHAICRLTIETVGVRRRPGSQLTVRLLLSPSVGCGRTYRISLPTR
jgi:hypothetical protein